MLNKTDDTGPCTICNVGGFMRRKSDEINRRPSMAILHSDGSVKWKKLDTSADVFVDEVKDRPETTVDIQDFIRGLKSLGEQGLDFTEAVKNHLNRDEIDPAVKQIILAAIETNV
jgi:hypothetical protein